MSARPTPRSIRRVAAATVLVAAGVAGGAAVAGAADGDTTVTVGPPVLTQAGAHSPFDAPGVRSIRQGKAIPKGYVLVRRSVEVTAGRGAAGAAVTVACPKGKRVRTLGFEGREHLGLNILDPNHYVGSRSLSVDMYPYGGSGTARVYAVCR